MADEGGSFRFRARVNDTLVFPGVRDVRPFLAGAVLACRPVALVTIYRCHGGDCRPGVQMAFTADDLSGISPEACSETDLACQARACLEDLRPRWLSYDDATFACGHIDVLIECLVPQDQALLTLLDMTRAHQGALWLSDGRDRSCLPCGPCNGTEAAGEMAEGAIWVRHNPV